MVGWELLFKPHGSELHASIIQENYIFIQYITTRLWLHIHGSVSAAKKNKKTGKNRTPHTSVLFTRTMI